MSVAFYCLDAYNTGSLHYAEMFHFYKLLFGEALDDDSILQLAAAAVLRGSTDVERPVGVTFKNFDQASVESIFCYRFMSNKSIIYSKLRPNGSF